MMVEGKLFRETFREYIERRSVQKELLVELNRIYLHALVGTLQCALEGF